MSFQIVQPRYVTEFPMPVPQADGTTKMMLSAVKFYYLDLEKVKAGKYFDFSSLDGLPENYIKGNKVRTYNYNPGYNYYISYQVGNGAYGFIQEEV